MEVNIKAIHFDATERLSEFVNKKAERLARRFPTISTMDVSMKVVKPETSMNKDVTVKVVIPQCPEMVANKVADSFEEAFDKAVEAIEHQLEKQKNAK
ncbi:MAG: ribosome-associated translation inhibitor RaiA [Muribaculaceae bacterium]|nr:ribosome-associated translation inhibitor RaiA [Muribaculaceae bacterium]